MQHNFKAGAKLVRNCGHVDVELPHLGLKKPQLGEVPSSGHSSPGSLKIPAENLGLSIEERIRFFTSSAHVWDPLFQSLELGGAIPRWRVAGSPSATMIVLFC